MCLKDPQLLYPPTQSQREDALGWQSGMKRNENAGSQATTLPS